MKKVKGSKGITLIALVITVIVLLILAGVSIATLTGPNGLLTSNCHIHSPYFKEDDMDESEENTDDSTEENTKEESTKADDDNKENETYSSSPANYSALPFEINTSNTLSTSQ